MKGLTEYRRLILLLKTSRKEENQESLAFYPTLVTRTRVEQV